MDKRVEELVGRIKKACRTKQTYSCNGCSVFDGGRCHLYKVKVDDPTNPHCFIPYKSETLKGA